MGFLRRLIGGGDRAPSGEVAVSDSERDGHAVPRTTVATTSATAPDDEAARDLELLREESRRLSDDLLARQLRYADRSWTPPAQGGPRRADDPDAGDA